MTTPNASEMVERISGWQPIGNQPIGMVVFTKNAKGLDVGVWDGREWSTEFGNGEPEQWARCSATTAAKEKHQLRDTLAEVRDTLALHGITLESGWSQSLHELGVRLARVAELERELAAARLDGLRRHEENGKYLEQQVETAREINSKVSQVGDALTAQSAEIKRLREALEKLANGSNLWARRIAREALAAKAT